MVDTFSTVRAVEQKTSLNLLNIIILGFFHHLKATPNGRNSDFLDFSQVGCTNAYEPIDEPALSLFVQNNSDKFRPTDTYIHEQERKKVGQREKRCVSKRVGQRERDSRHTYTHTNHFYISHTVSFIYAIMSYILIAILYN